MQRNVERVKNMSFPCVSAALGNDRCLERCEACAEAKKNINFESVPNVDKHNVSSRTLTKLEKVMFKQDDYGIEKYKKPLKHNYRYDWLEMFMEEMADGLKYIQNEMDRKELIIGILGQGLESENPKKYIQTALELLSMKGTGK
jgi:hypothetical protein